MRTSRQPGGTEMAVMVDTLSYREYSQIVSCTEGQRKDKSYFEARRIENKILRENLCPRLSPGF